MSQSKKACFVIMPFVPELHYFYLYIKKHVEETYNIKCERADAKVLTIPLLDKIVNYIRNADIIIADCSGRNPNVFYELGIAHTLGRKVILITKDPLKEAPSDIKHYDFVHYELDKHVEILEKLDNAFRNILVKDYDRLYARAKDIFQKFKDGANADISMVPKEVFVSRVIAAERTRDLPSMEDALALQEFLLPKIVADSNDYRIMEKITKWLSDKIAQAHRK